MTLEFIDRNAWGAGDLKSGYRVPHSQFKRLFVHHTVKIMQDYDRDGYLHGDHDDVIRYMRMLQYSRPDLGDEVPYSLVIFKGSGFYDAIISEGRGWGVTGAHTSGYNSKAYGIALAGNFSEESVTEGMISAIRWLGSMLHDPANALPTLGHRDVKATQCPGNNAYPLLHRLQPPFGKIYIPSPIALEIKESDQMYMVVKTVDGPEGEMFWYVWYHDSGLLLKKRIQGIEWLLLHLKYEKELITRPYSDVAGILNAQF